MTPLGKGSADNLNSGMPTAVAEGVTKEPATPMAFAEMASPKTNTAAPPTAVNMEKPHTLIKDGSLAEKTLIGMSKQQRSQAAMQKQSSIAG